MYSGSASSLPLTNSQSRPDLLIRTSGESRLSDFLLWQSTYSVTHFANVLWPDFGLHHLMAAIFHYQSKKYYIGQIINSLPLDSLSNTTTFSEKFVDQERTQRMYNFLETLDNSKSISPKTDNKYKYTPRITGSHSIEEVNDILGNK